MCICLLGCCYYVIIDIVAVSLYKHTIVIMGIISNMSTSNKIKHPPQHGVHEGNTLVFSAQYGLAQLHGPAF